MAYSKSGNRSGGLIVLTAMAVGVVAVGAVAVGRQMVRRAWVRRLWDEEPRVRRKLDGPPPRLTYEPQPGAVPAQPNGR